MRQVLAGVPFLRKAESSIRGFYKKDQHVSVLSLTHVVRPKPLRISQANKENISPVPICSKADNPEDNPVKRKAEYKEQQKTVKMISSADLDSAMDYPTRFAPFINSRNKLQDPHNRVLKPLTNSNSNRLCQAMQVVKPESTRNAQEDSLSLCVEMAEQVLQSPQETVTRQSKERCML